jgi:uncharacterized protein involved in exopolysaccharide biosynthesis
MIETEERDPREVFLRLWAHRRWIAACVAVSTVGFIIAAFLITPIYRATTVLAPASSSRSSLSNSLSSTLGQLGSIASMVGVNVGSVDIETEEAIAILRSRQFTEGFISDQNLLPELFDSLWDRKTSTWSVTGDKQPTLGKAYKKFDEQVRSITEDKKTGLVLLQVDWRDPAMAALWANSLVDRLNRAMRARALAQVTKSLSFLDGELEKTTDTDTRLAINRLVEMQIRQRMLANVTEEYAFRIVDRATAPDKWDRIRPKRVLMAISGLLAGLVFGLLSVAIRTSLSERGHSSREVSKG